MVAAALAIASVALQESTPKVVASGLQVPWDIEPVNANRIYVMERPGRVRVIVNGSLRPGTYATPPLLAVAGQGGLLDMALSPSYATNKHVFLTYTVQSGGKYFVRLARFRDTGTGLVIQKVLLNGPLKDDPAHFGGRLCFGPQGKLFMTFGERHSKELAQKLNVLNGKIVRINPDGTIPTDNPFYNTVGARKEIWSYGHRNPYGLSYDPVTGILGEAEHGPSGYDAPHGYDEINIIRKGANYGWPVIWGANKKTGMRNADWFWVEATAPGSATFSGRNLIVSFLGGQAMVRARIVGGKVTVVEKLLGSQYGRIRATAVLPDGTIFFSTSNGEGGSAVDKIYSFKPLG